MIITRINYTENKQRTIENGINRELKRTQKEKNLVFLKDR